MLSLLDCVFHLAWQSTITLQPKLWGSSCCIARRRGHNSSFLNSPLAWWGVFLCFLNVHSGYVENRREKCKCQREKQGKHKTRVEGGEYNQQILCGQIRRTWANWFVDEEKCCHLVSFPWCSFYVYNRENCLFACPVLIILYSRQIWKNMDS